MFTSLDRAIPGIPAGNVGILAGAVRKQMRRVGPVFLKKRPRLAIDQMLGGRLLALGASGENIRAIRSHGISCNRPWQARPYSGSSSQGFRGWQGEPAQKNESVSPILSASSGFFPSTFSERGNLRRLADDHTRSVGVLDKIETVANRSRRVTGSHTRHQIVARPAQAGGIPRRVRRILADVQHARHAFVFKAMKSQCGQCSSRRSLEPDFRDPPRVLPRFPKSGQRRPMPRP